MVQISNSVSFLRQQMPYSVFTSGCYVYQDPQGPPALVCSVGSRGTGRQAYTEFRAPPPGQPCLPASLDSVFGHLSPEQGYFSLALCKVGRQTSPRSPFLSVNHCPKGLSRDCRSKPSRRLTQGRFIAQCGRLCRNSRLPLHYC